MRHLKCIKKKKIIIKTVIIKTMNIVLINELLTKMIKKLRVHHLELKK